MRTDFGACWKYDKFEIWREILDCFDSTVEKFHINGNLLVRILVHDVC